MLFLFMALWLYCARITFRLFKAVIVDLSSFDADSIMVEALMCN